AAGVDKSARCDAVAFSFGLKAETQLADLAGCRFRFDGPSRQWLPERNEDGEITVSCVYLAGDGVAIGGADAAELWAERVGLAIAARCGRQRDVERIATVDRRLARLARFRAVLAQAFPLPLHDSHMSGDTVLCRR